MLWLVLNDRGIACLVEVFTFNRYVLVYRL